MGLFSQACQLICKLLQKQMIMSYHNMVRRIRNVIIIDAKGALSKSFPLIAEINAGKGLGGGIERN